MRSYADTSVIIAYYGNDVHSSQAQALVLSARQPLPFTALHRLEAKTALKLAVFRGRTTSSAAEAALREASTDMRARKLRRVRLDWEAVFRAAARLGWRHSSQLGVRSFDALHLAAAMTLATREFLSFDKRQRDLARALGLTVLPAALPS